MSVSIESIFNKNRFPQGPALILVLLYVPVGVVIFILRLFISLQLFLASSILPYDTYLRSLVLRTLYSILGLVVREEYEDKKDKGCRIITTNHITPFDHLAVSLVIPCVTPSVYDLPAGLSNLLCYRDLGVTRGREALRANVRTFLSDANSPPLLLHPEGATTSGNISLMKYGSWAFDLDGSVLAVGVKVWRCPVPPIAPSVLGASWAADLCFTLFCPLTVFTIKYIGKISRIEGESPEDFSARVQSATATALGLQTSNHTVADKVEYMKRAARALAMASNPLLSPEIHNMALQVREVLPYLPLDIIKRDLVRTRNVDATLTNFLEGNIPEPIPQYSAPAPVVTATAAATSRTPSLSSSGASGSPASTLTSPPSTSTVEPGNVVRTEGNSTEGNSLITLNTAAKAFGKSATERISSFEWRKQQLIDNARRKFIEKHDLKIAGYNC